MIYSILIAVQVLVSIAIIVLVLVQHGKGADAGAAFGSGASGTVFGARGSSTFLSRTTAILATIFFVNSLAMAWFAAHPSQGTSIFSSPSVQKVINGASNKKESSLNGGVKGNSSHD